jgi:hypothetical protein
MNQGNLGVAIALIFFLVAFHYYSLESFMQQSQLLRTAIEILGNVETETLAFSLRLSNGVWVLEG